MLIAMGAAGAASAFKVTPTLAQEHAHGAMKDDKMMAPLSNHTLHFCGFHAAKANPDTQIVTQHYCGMVGGTMHQCLLYDSVEKGAKLLGVEYIVPDEMFQKLPEEEKKYWHPHTYEVLGGGLIAPSMNKADEMAFMKVLLNTWGKTWHTWPDPTTPVPMGEPLLMWALTADGQDKPGMVSERDKQFGVDSKQISKDRIAEIGFEKPMVPQPKSVDTIGRQWTAEGADKPTPAKK